VANKGNFGKNLSISDLTKTLAANLKKEEPLSTVEWIKKHRIKTEDGIPFDFEKRKFLVEFYNDMNPRQAIRASAQVGKTVGLYVKSLKIAMDMGLNILFSEPTMDLRDSLTKSKLNRLVEQNKIFKDVVSGDLNLKRIKDSNMFLSYTYGSAGGIGVSSDMNIYDEVSRSNPQMIDLFKSRLLNSEYGWEIWCSNPNVPEDLLDKKWKESDQKHWAIRCSHCGKRQILNYDGLEGGHKANVDKIRQCFVCQYCDRELAMQDRIDGEWVPKYKHRQNDPYFISGYWIHQLMRHNCSVPELIAEEKKNLHTFNNMFLGRPYSGSSVSLNGELIKQHLDAPRHYDDDIVAGIDVGASQEGSGGHHYIIASRNTIFAMGKARSFIELEEIMGRYGVQSAVIDYMPEYEGAKNFQSAFPNQVLRCRFLGNKTTKDQVINYEFEKGMVHVQKHIQFDNIVNDIAAGRYKFAFNSNDRLLEDFCRQCSTMSKIPELDSSGNPTYKWTAPENSADHFAMSLLYLSVAQDRLEMMKPINGYYNAEAGYNKEFVQPQDGDFFNGEKSQKSWLDL
jgi:hypothetical protein